MGPNLLVSSSLILFLDPTRVALRDSQFKNIPYLSCSDAWCSPLPPELIHCLKHAVLAILPLRALSF